MAIRVLIVDDSSFFRKRIADIVACDPQMEVAGFAANGREAIQQAKELKPDVVTMDVEMPIMNGIDSIKGIMAESPVPVIMFSSLTEEGADLTFKALEAGALDYITKNFDDIARNRDEAMDEIRAKIKNIARQKYQVQSIARSKYGYSMSGHHTSTPKEEEPTDTSSLVDSRKKSSFSSSSSGTTSTIGSSITNRSTLTSRSSMVTSSTSLSRVTPSATISKTPTTTRSILNKTQTQRPMINSSLATRSTTQGTSERKVLFSSRILDSAPLVKPTTVCELPELIASKCKHSGKKYDLVVIGSSTGGPVALQTVLTGFPEDFPVPILLVQHMQAMFTSTFSARLDKLSKLTVSEAKTGDTLQPGHAYMAPGGKQLLLDGRGVRSSRIKIVESDAKINYRPCIDLTLASVNNVIGGNVLVVILTGMGADGHDGCKLLKDKGATIWAQNEATCVIYGMPQAVVKDKTASHVIPLSEISGCIIKEVIG